MIQWLKTKLGWCLHEYGGPINVASAKGEFHIFVCSKCFRMKYRRFEP